MTAGEYLFKFKLKTTIPFECILKNLSKMANQKVEFFLKKKNPPRAQIFPSEQ